MNVTVKPELLAWARKRASLTVDELAQAVGTKKRPAPIGEWEGSLTAIEIPARTLELIAQKTHAPFGMLFLTAPPVEPLPIRDFRRQNDGARQPSLNLLETVYENQVRQTWLSETLHEDGESPLTFIGSARIGDNVTEVARNIRDTLRIGTEERRRITKIAAVVLWMIERLEESRITVIRKGYAGTSTRRSLDPAEFKGFALSDPYAPFIFVNGKDWSASQMFTIVHECVHLWLGESALPNGDWYSDATEPVERFCNQVAAEVLIPAEELARFWSNSLPAEENARRGGMHFKVSSLAVLFRARNTGLITEAVLARARQEIAAEFETVASDSGGSRGGDYYNNVGIHLGKRFIREVLMRTLEGRTLYSEAFDLLGTRKTSVVQEMARRFL